VIVERPTIWLFMLLSIAVLIVRFGARKVLCLLMIAFAPAISTELPRAFGY
jgi:hypothetical protein